MFAYISVLMLLVASAASATSPAPQSPAPQHDPVIIIVE
jgi:hypothetical protein